MESAILQKNWKERFVLGITGNIGGGKSTATRLFSEFGAALIDSDQIARTFTAEDTPIRKELVEVFGNEIFDENNQIDRKKIASIVFFDKVKLKKLTDLIHPEVRKQALSQIQAIHSGQVIAWEVPLLFENQLNVYCDATLSVGVDEELAIERVRRRENMSRLDYQARISNQFDLKKKIELSDLYIINNKDLEYLKTECFKIYNEILGLRRS